MDNATAREVENINLQKSHVSNSWRCLLSKGRHLQA